MIRVRTSKVGPTLLVGAVTVLLYGVSGRVALELSPRHLPFTALDLAVPFLPWTFWIYSSIYFIYFTSCFLQKDLAVFEKFLTGYVIAYVLAGALFLAFPTTFPRDLFPLPAETNSLTREAFLWFRSIDAPTNCFPSMHVGSCVMATMPFYKRRPRVFLFFCAWTAAIGMATITTKQHYVADVLAGAVFGLFAHFLALSWLPRFRARVLEI